MIDRESKIDGEERVGLLIHPVDSRLRGNDGVLVLSCFTLTLVLSHQGRGGFHLTAALWIPAYAGMTVKRCWNDGPGGFAWMGMDYVGGCRLTAAPLDCGSSLQ